MNNENDKISSVHTALILDRLEKIDSDIHEKTINIFKQKNMLSKELIMYEHRLDCLDRLINSILIITENDWKLSEDEIEDMTIDEYNSQLETYATEIYKVFISIIDKQKSDIDLSSFMNNIKINKKGR